MMVDPPSPLRATADEELLACGTASADRSAYAETST